MIPNLHRPLRAAVVSVAVILGYFAGVKIQEVTMKPKALTAQVRVTNFLGNLSIILERERSKDAKFDNKNLEEVINNKIKLLNSVGELKFDYRYVSRLEGVDFFGKPSIAHRAITLKIVPEYGQVNDLLCKVFEEENEKFPDSTSTSCVEVGGSLELVTKI